MLQSAVLCPRIELDPLTALSTEHNVRYICCERRSQADFEIWLGSPNLERLAPNWLVGVADLELACERTPIWTTLKEVMMAEALCV